LQCPWKVSLNKPLVLPTAIAPDKWTLGSLYTLFVLGLTGGLQMSDLGVQSLSLSVIQVTFDIGDTAVGAIQGVAGFLLGSFFAIPLSRLVDKYSRKRILLSFLFASTTMMILSALAPNFTLFFIGRASVAVIEFAMVPLVYSMIPDLSPEKDRVFANLGFAAIMAAGASGGFYFGGAIISFADLIIPLDVEAWRKGFLLLALCGIPLFAIALLTSEPPRYRGLVEQSSDSIVAFIQQRWKSVVLFLGGAGFLLIAIQALNQLIALALERRFDADIVTVGQAMGVILLVVSGGSIPIAGLLDKLLSQRVSYASRPIIMMIGAVLSIPICVLLNAVNQLDYALVTIGTFLFLTAVANALVPTMLQDIVPHPIRGRCFAIWSFLVSLFSSVGPLLSGIVSDEFLNKDLLGAITLITIPTLALSAFFSVKLTLHLKAHNYRP